jgi:hypothetical protein
MLVAAKHVSASATSAPALRRFVMPPPLELTGKTLKASAGRLG